MISEGSGDTELYLNRKKVIWNCSNILQYDCVHCIFVLVSKMDYFHKHQ